MGLRVGMEGTCGGGGSGGGIRTEADSLREVGTVSARGGMGGTPGEGDPENASGQYSAHGAAGGDGRVQIVTRSTSIPHNV
jgi:hypothetical protein